MFEITSKHVAVILAIILVLVVLFLVKRQLEEYKLMDDPMIDQLKIKIAPLIAKGKQTDPNLSMLENRDLMSEVSFYKGNKSYTINKQKIFLCLKDEKGEYYNLNLLVYVLTHELSHSLCESIGHTSEFHKIFESLLKKAADMGIYDPSLPIDENYCTYAKDD